ncbi:MAG: ketoacyl-ACP synthase III [Chloroflexi bacterium]|nr:MAG: ketoacyl-ACP synthase III [Chloroflexota bacterium]
MQLNVPLKIAGLGRYLPERIVTNPELEALYGLRPGWVEHHNGVRERRRATTETNSSMGAAAAVEALAEAGLKITDINLILNASGTAEQAIPDTAALIQRALGVGDSGIPCMSVHVTCLSFLAALDVCASFLAAGRYRNILVVSSEISSVGLNPNQPESATLIGDAAAAAVITSAGAGESSQLHHSLFRTYGEGADHTAVRGGGTRRHPNLATTTPEDNYFHMDGGSVLRLVRTHVDDYLEKLYPGLATGLVDIDAVVPHQASKVGLRMLGRFGWADEKIIRTLDWLGNCVAASIPVTLYEGVRDGRIRRGDKVLLVGTGAGLSMGGLVLTY